jgi:hypothetical protein
LLPLGIFACLWAFVALKHLLLNFGICCPYSYLPLWAFVALKHFQLIWVFVAHMHFCQFWAFLLYSICCLIWAFLPLGILACFLTICCS